MHFLDADQVNALAGAVEDRYRTAIYTAAYGGLRAGELWALRVDRLNVLGRTIDVVESLSEVRGRLVVGPTKTGKRRSITVPRFLAEMLGEHVGRYSAGYLFTAAEGDPVRHRNFMRRHFQPACIVLDFGQVVKDEAGARQYEGLRFHDTRHTCAALLIANGRHLEEVKDHLGHSSIRVTSDRYGHLFPKARAELADSLDATFRSSAPAPADFSRTNRGLGRLPGAEQVVRPADSWSGRRDSNPRPSPWQGDALPTEPRPREATTLPTARAPEQPRTSVSSQVPARAVRQPEDQAGRDTPTEPCRLRMPRPFVPSPRKGWR